MVAWLSKAKEITSLTAPLVKWYNSCLVSINRQFDSVKGHHDGSKAMLWKCRAGRRQCIIRPGPLASMIEY